MLDAACRHFPSIPRNEVMLQTNQLAVCDGHYAEITAEVWDDILHLPHPVEVTRRVEMTLPVPLPLDNQLAPSKVNEQDSCSYAPNILQVFPVLKLRPHNRNDDEAWYVDPNPSGQAPECDDQVTIKLVFRSGGIQTTKISREMQVDKLVADVSQTLGHSPASGLSVKAIFGGVTMCANRTIGSYDIEDGDSINIRVNDCTRIKKPVIYAR